MLDSNDASFQLGGVSDVLTFAATGIVVVILGLSAMAGIVSFFKYLNPIVMEKKKTSEPKKPSVKLDEGEIAAIAAAMTIERTLYYDDKLREPTFNYTPKKVFGWNQPTRER